MIIDNLGTASVTYGASAGTYYSTDNIDLMPVSSTAGNSGRIANTLIDLGEGEPLYATITVTTAFAGMTSVAFNLVTATTGTGTGGTAPTSPTVHWTSGAITSLPAAGTTIQFVVPASAGDPVYKRYLYLSIVTVGGTGTAGVARLDLTVGQPDGKTFYKSGLQNSLSGV